VDFEVVQLLPRASATRIEVKAWQLAQTLPRTRRPKVDQSLELLAAMYNLEVHQMDVTTAYLNGSIDEELYMCQPERFVDEQQQPDRVLRLRKALCGLKLAGKKLGTGRTPSEVKCTNIPQFRQ
jgi:Reverse transcriptase (RNA-dependent DNA polymerase)